MLKETEGRGPYCSLVMAVVVTKDVLVFICFSLNVELSALVLPRLALGFTLSPNPETFLPGCALCAAQALQLCFLDSENQLNGHVTEGSVRCCQVMRNAGEGFRVASLAGPLGSLFRSIALGAAAGALIGRVTSLPARPFNWALRRLPQAAGGRVKARVLGFSDSGSHAYCSTKHPLHAPPIPLYSQWCRCTHA